MTKQLKVEEQKEEQKELEKSEKEDEEEDDRKSEDDKEVYTKSLKYTCYLTLLWSDFLPYIVSLFGCILGSIWVLLLVIGQLIYPGSL